jgi:soluble lytic murein transglycosylase
MRKNSIFIFSVIAQESSFEGFVHSSAGARGLMQIIPSTGQERAQTLGWPINFNPDDLYRPNVSIRLGASYLYKNLYDFNGDYFAALAAYNAGPGYALLWKNLSGTDPDLFLEVVRFTNSDPYDYLWSIYEIFVVYRSIYGSTP